MTEEKPARIKLRTYQVGFGDCFLLTFLYPRDARAAKEDPENEQHYSKRHVLIDFGSTGFPDSIAEEIQKSRMVDVAKDIKQRCGGKLDVVVASHRHKDHISGFRTTDAGDGPGDIIRSCRPKVIVQPWTEDPDLAEDATSFENRLKDPTSSAKNLRASHVSSLLNMSRTANKLIKKEAERIGHPNTPTTAETKAVAKELEFLAEDAGYFAAHEKKPNVNTTKIANASAVENLEKMAREGKPHYVHYGYNLNLVKFLPGVKVTVLGPPTIEQYEKIKRQRSADKEEFWMLYAATAGAGSELIDEEITLFPDAKVYDKNYVPSHARWFVGNLLSIRGDQLLQIARTMDHAINNTSVILLFEAGKEKLLFPGDAQIENWEYALKFAPARSRKKNLNLLKQTTFYKVGHHGSRNATPKSLWDCFALKKQKIIDENDKTDKTGKRLQTVISTMAGKHGHTPETAVPRQTLVDQLNDLTDYYTTQKLADAAAEVKGQLFPIQSKESPGLWGEIEIVL